MVGTLVLAITSAGWASLPPQEAPGSTTPIDKDFLIWVEVNVPMRALSRVFPEQARTRPGFRCRDFCLEALTLWGEVTDTILVSTRPGNVEALYPFLMRNKPGHVRIIGGLKTYTLPGCAPADKRPFDYADAAGWRRLTEEAQRIVTITGQNAVLFESETALSRFNSGKAGIDFAKLRESLKPLRESGIKVYWYVPSILVDIPKFPSRQAQTAKLVKTIAAAVPNSVFLDTYTGLYDWRRRTGEVERRRLMLDIVGPERFPALLYVTTDGYLHFSPVKKKRCYTPAEAIEAVRTRPGPQFLLYPGHADWVDLAREMIRVMPRRAGKKP